MKLRFKRVTLSNYGWIVPGCKQLTEFEFCNIAALEWMQMGVRQTWMK